MAELIMQEESSTPATPGSGKWKFYPKADGWYILDDAGLEFGPVGPLYDYIITPSISSNNLTIAIKNIAGADPSSSRTLIFRVGNTIYQAAAALSFTMNAGTNWCNAGSAELATQDVDYFVYAISETGAAAGLKFGFSRIPYAKTMGDFVNTTTSEKYITGNWTNFNATNPVKNIGRFRARLSAGAGYTWSIPNAKVINYPIYETDLLIWQPTFTGFSSNPTDTHYYKIRGQEVYFQIYQTTGTSNGTGFTMTMPFTPTYNHIFPAFGIDNGVVGNNPARFLMTAATLAADAKKLLDGTVWTNTGTKFIRVSGFYAL